MIAQAQSALSNLTGPIKALAGSHPVVTGVVLGIGAYYAVNKYWLNKEETTETEESAAAE